MKRCSVVVPCYNEEETVDIYYNEMMKYISNMPELEFEFIFVDDGSKDNTLQVIKNLSNKDERVKYVSFSRNFGKESGLYAGLEAASGDYIVKEQAEGRKYRRMLYFRRRRGLSDKVLSRSSERCLGN